MNPIEVISQFYERDTDLWRILVEHSEAVADFALRIVDSHPELGADRQFVYEGAMLHDIGIIKTDAPGIHCYGDSPYICHGTLGAEMLRGLGMERHALVCERHTGAGLSLEDIERQDLPIPHRDMLPLSVEEKIICYADKYFSKSKELRVAKSYEKALKSVAKFGEDSERRFLEMHEKFGK
ncbi:MAG: HDIG domain-containing protein [Bacteroidia bacterium]|nr:HDIG domain-containing protein [Bacteroidia bacterium]